MGIECVSAENERKIKCVVWDLDNTIWDGTLIEGDTLSLKDGVPEVLQTLDRRGVLQSIASKNDYSLAMEKLREFGLENFFLYPQIHWNSKAESIKEIQKTINIGMDTIAFIDDQPFELEEVKYSFPDVFCIDAADLNELPDLPELNPRFITDESKIRRQMYVSDMKRNKIEESYTGSKEEFLTTLDMALTIAPAKEEDLKRAEELTMRTHQLNTTGYTYTYDDLNRLRLSDDHILLVASLDDRFGTYGKIGLTLIECREDIWLIKLLLMSCRVMSRGVGSIMINYIRQEAEKRGLRLQAEMVPTDRNRMMYMTYKFSNFKEIESTPNFVMFENDLIDIPDFPEYVNVECHPF